MKTAHILTTLLACACAAHAADTVVGTFPVNEYFGVQYDTEPVYFDVSFDKPVVLGRIALKEAGQFVPFQVEILDGRADAVSKARVWTNVSFQHVVDPESGKSSVAPGKDRHKVFQVVLTDRQLPAWKPAAEDKQFVAGIVGPLPVHTVTNQAGFAARVVTIEEIDAKFATPASAFLVQGPVVSVSRDGEEWIGNGYLETMHRVISVSGQSAVGPVFWESKLTYRFEGDKTYTARVRIFAKKPYAQLTEDFDLGGAAKYVFNFEDWKVDGFFFPGDQRLVNWESITAKNPAGDFVQIEGQKALARMVIWSQFNYFRGKQETIGVKAADPEALRDSQEKQLARYKADLTEWNNKQQEYHQAVQAYQKEMAEYEKEPSKFRRKPQAPRQPRGREPQKPQTPEIEQTTYRLGGAPIETSVPVTPGGTTTAVGAFYIRPDLWTRAKVNHVDLYMRPEVPDPDARTPAEIIAQRMTRGVVGLDGARQRLAMEAWLVDGQRQWAIFAVPSGEKHFFAKAHVLEGVWPLRRLNNLTLVWNSDGSAVKPEDTMPSDTPVGGPAGAVLLGTGGRSGLQFFNGSNGHIRWTPPTDGFDGTVKQTMAQAGQNDRMVSEAATCYMASDDSAYPSLRAMLPWSDPEAINPFYQGMENMNFNADLYRYIAGHAVRLLEMGHPEGGRFLDHAEKSFDRALDTYVYPGSGCWEESHGYASHTIKVTGPLSLLLRNSGRTNFLDDIRYARMAEFFLDVHSPVDPVFGNRVVPPVGDHGLKKDGPVQRFKTSMSLFGQSDDPEIRKIVRRMAWMIREQGGDVDESIQSLRPAMKSRWLRGYGTVLRGFGDEPTAWQLTLPGAVGVIKKDDFQRRDLILTVPRGADGAKVTVSGASPTLNRASHSGQAVIRRPGGKVSLDVDMTIGSDRWVKGGPASYKITLQRDGESWSGRYAGTFNGRDVSGDLSVAAKRPESFAVLRAGQSWGHHHEDKGSLWFWGRNVHFFGDCSWGSPPGGTYWNPFK
ncbi:MAG: hypothetical protein ACOCZE_03090, partial [Planctomycetota bacterium]